MQQDANIMATTRQEELETALTRLDALTAAVSSLNRLIESRDADEVIWKMYWKAAERAYHSLSSACSDSDMIQARLQQAHPSRDILASTRPDSEATSHVRQASNGRQLIERKPAGNQDNSENDSSADESSGMIGDITDPTPSTSQLPSTRPTTHSRSPGSKKRSATQDSTIDNAKRPCVARSRVISLSSGSDASSETSDASSSTSSSNDSLPPQIGPSSGQWPSNIVEEYHQLQTMSALDEDHIALLQEARALTYDPLSLLYHASSEFNSEEQSFIAKKIMLKKSKHPKWCELVTSKAWIEAGLPGAYPNGRISRQILKGLPPPPVVLSGQKKKPQLPSRPANSHIKDPVVPYTGPTDEAGFLRTVNHLDRANLVHVLRSMGARVGTLGDNKEALKAFGVAKLFEWEKWQTEVVQYAENKAYSLLVTQYAAMKRSTQLNQEASKPCSKGKERAMSIEV